MSDAPPSYRILHWDIEATHLAASIGTVVCIGYKWHGEAATKVLAINNFKGWRKDPGNDRALLLAFEKVYLQADMQVTWFGKRFDLPFIQTRRLWYGLPPLPQIPHFDGWETARKKLKLHSNRLATVQDFLDLPEVKTPLSFRALSRSVAGHLPSLNEVVHHCSQDVKVLEMAYEKLRPFGGDFHPNRAIMGDPKGCPTCGSPNIGARGYAAAQTRAYRRYNCKDCGRWFRVVRQEAGMRAEVR